MTADDHLPPAVVAQLGVPVPVTVYGFKARGKGVEMRRPVRAELQFETSPLVDLPVCELPLTLAVSAALSVVLGDAEGSLDTDARFTTLGLDALVGPWWPWDATHAPGLSVGLGPALLFEHVQVDENLRLDTWSVGMRARLRLTVPLTTDLAVVLDGGWERYGPPVDRDTYFNYPLGRTVLSFVTLGVRLAVR